MKDEYYELFYREPSPEDRHYTEFRAPGSVDPWMHGQVDVSEDGSRWGRTYGQKIAQLSEEAAALKTQLHQTQDRNRLLTQKRDELEQQLANEREEITALRFDLSHYDNQVQWLASNLKSKAKLKEFNELLEGEEFCP